MEIDGFAIEDIAAQDYSDMEVDSFRAIRDIPARDRLLLVSYAELGSMRKVSELYNLSERAIHYRIECIRTKLKNKLKR